MSLTAERAKSYLDQKDLRYEYFEATEDRKEALSIGFGGKNKESIKLYLIFDDDGNSVNIKSYTVAKVPEDKLIDMYIALNELNYEYRWVKFYIDDDKEVTVSGDAILDEANAGPECFEIIVRYIGIIDEIYPRIMKVLWA